MWLWDCPAVVITRVIFVSFVARTVISHIYCLWFCHRNWSILERILLQIALPDQSVMICSTGKRPSWDQKTLRMPAEFSFSTFTFPRIILSRYESYFSFVAFRCTIDFDYILHVGFHFVHSCSLPRSTSPHASITATSIQTEAFVSTSWRTNGVQPWQSVKSSSVSALCWPTPIPMIRSSLILLSFWRRTKLDTTALLGNGLRSMPCKRVDPSLLKQLVSMNEKNKQNYSQQRHWQGRFTIEWQNELIDRSIPCGLAKQHLLL